MLNDTLDFPALILGDDHVNVLGVTRNLGRAGIPVYRLGADSSRILNSRYTKAVWAKQNLDDCSDEEYLTYLSQAAEGIGQPAVLFPLSDIHVLKVARHLESLSDRFFPVSQVYEVADTLVNKRRFYESLERQGIAHPKSRYPTTPDEFVEAAEGIGYPVFIKPEVSPLFARRFRRKGLVANDPAELLDRLKTLEGTGLEVLVQEIIPGDADCMHGCAGVRTAEGIASFCYQRVREYPPKFGCGSLMRSVDNFIGDTRLASYLESLDYSGIFDAEFKKDPRDGQFKMIEINARSWWQNLHPTASGINLVKGAYDLALGRKPELNGYTTGRQWMHLYNDFFAREAAGIGLFAWLNSLRQVNAFDIWAVDDPKPMLRFLTQVFGGWLRNKV